MLSHSVLFSSEASFREFETKLGDQAELGAALQLIDVNGVKLIDVGFRADTPLPMANIKNIGIALAVLINCFAPDSTIKINQKVTVITNDLSPGPMNNPLDQYFCKPNTKEPIVTITVYELLKNMLEYSDNTSADRLLELIGGQLAVNSILDTYLCHSFKLSRYTRNLLSSVFQLNLNRNANNLAAWKQVLEESTDVMRYQAEVDTYMNGDDACSPQDICTLLNLIIRHSCTSQKPELQKPASHLLQLMKLCKSGPHRIKDIIAYRGDVEFVAHQSTTLGGVTNDAAIIKFTDGQHAVISIFTAFSNATPEVRESVIADVALALLKTHKPIVKTDKQYSKSY